MMVLFLCLVDPVWHCDHLVEEGGSLLLCFPLVCDVYCMSWLVCSSSSYRWHAIVCDCGS